MKSLQIENWALSVIERVESGKPNEDFRVELKSQWIDPQKAARQIAGHANAARGEHILWLIGVDQANGVIGANHMELADWYAKVKAQFDGLAPQLVDLNVPVKRITVVALLFETDRAPFVIKNPAYGSSGGGSVSLEVPWRENTSTRSATRSDLIKLLSPLQKLPSFEILSGELVVQSMSISSPPPIKVTWQGAKSGPNREWHLTLELYIEPKNTERVVIPLHRCNTWLEIIGLLPRTPFQPIFLSSPCTGVGEMIVSQSLTIKSTNSELLIDGPGKLSVYSSVTIPTVEDSFTHDVQVTVTLRPVNTEHSISINATLVPSPPSKQSVSTRWTLKHSP
jgi:hypothetical protein